MIPWWAWAAIGVGCWLLLVAWVCGICALGKRADRLMARKWGELRRDGTELVNN